MPTPICAILWFILLVSSTSAIAQESTLSGAQSDRDRARQEALVQATLRALADGSLASFKAVHTRRAEMTVFPERDVDTLLEERARRHEQILKAAREAGVDLTAMRLVSSARTGPARVWKGIRVIGDIEVIIESRGRQFRMLLDDVFEVGGRWAMTDRIKGFRPVAPPQTPISAPPGTAPGD